MPLGFLGASPDGLISEDGIIGVKCPFSAREKTLSEFLASKDCYLKENSNGEHILDNKHNYFHQIQGTLYATGRKYCDFVCWSPKWITISRIYRSDSWKTNLILLEIFYEEVFLDYWLNNLE